MPAIERHVAHSSRLAREMRRRPIRARGDPRTIGDFADALAMVIELVPDGERDELAELGEPASAAATRNVETNLRNRSDRTPSAVRRAPNRRDRRSARATPYARARASACVTASTPSATSCARSSRASMSPTRTPRAHASAAAVPAACPSVITVGVKRVDASASCVVEMQRPGNEKLLAIDRHEQRYGIS